MLIERGVGHCAQADRVGIHEGVVAGEDFCIFPLRGDPFVPSSGRPDVALEIGILVGPGDEPGGADTSEGGVAP
jgi:hypothetical protein